MNDETKALIQDALEASREEKRKMRSRKLIVGKWAVYKDDPQNWACAQVGKEEQDDAKETRYYGRVEHALKYQLSAVFGDKLSETGDLKQAVAAIKEAQASVDKLAREGVLNG